MTRSRLRRAFGSKSVLTCAACAAAAASASSSRSSKNSRSHSSRLIRRQNVIVSTSLVPLIQPSKALMTAVWSTYGRLAKDSLRKML